MIFFLSRGKYMPNLEIANGNFPFKVLTLTLDLPYMHLLFLPWIQRTAFLKLSGHHIHPFYYTHQCLWFPPWLAEVYFVWVLLHKHTHTNRKYVLSIQLYLTHGKHICCIFLGKKHKRKVTLLTLIIINYCLFYICIINTQMQRNVNIHTPLLHHICESSSY